MSVQPTPSTTDQLDREIAVEQAHLDLLHRRLDEVRTRTIGMRRQALLSDDQTPGGLTERDIATTRQAERIAEYTAAEYGLCFGRLDFIGDDRPLYVGRTGIFDDDYEPLLVDWRAPSARPFYLATAAAPLGVARRRGLRTSKRRVVGLDDEILDLNQAAADGAVTVTGEAGLMAALTAGRTGRMSDIVSTIQSEQDRIIRADQHGVLVVQGGPGTGKTAVALHRAAYLMYTHRERMARSGVLVVGPNQTFLHYIENVLPSLGESAVVLATVGTLFPGVVATRVDPPLTTAVKGLPVMSTVLARALADRQLIPDEPEPVEFEDHTLHLDATIASRAREAARGSRRPHNLAREIFAREVIRGLAEQYADVVGANVLGGARLLDAQDIADVRAEMADDPAIDGVIDLFWPSLTPQQFLGDLLSATDRIEDATEGLAFDASMRAALYRKVPFAADPAEMEWSGADVPLLDEAAALLGEDRSAERARVAAARSMEIDYAQGVLDIIEGSRSADFEDDAEEEMLSAADLIDADQLADRQDRSDGRSLAERAAADREWTYGHVIVDEAQELSPMAWRTLMRRCPTRSMTLVGDVAQTSDPAGTSSWAAVLEPYVGDRWTQAVLTVNYRTPSEISALADRVLTTIDPEATAPTAVRKAGEQPWFRHVAAGELDATVTAAVTEEMTRIGDGRVAVIAPRDRLAHWRELLGGHAVTDLVQPLVVIGVEESKGLEFDTVLLLEPAELVAESDRGLNNLYVALTRPTRRLGVVHTAPLPAAMGGPAESVTVPVARPVLPTTAAVHTVAAEEPMGLW